jgi:hypothetical protein
MITALPVRDHMLITIASSYYKHAGVRDTHFRERTGMSPTLASQRVNWLIDQHHAIAARPMECHQLRDLRDARRRQRTARDRLAS